MTTTTSLTHDRSRGGRAALDDEQALTVEVPRGRPTGEWGMLLFILTEATLFATLLACYFYLRFVHGGPWPTDGTPPPKLGRPLLMSGLLFSSSATMVWADLAVRRIANVVWRGVDLADLLRDCGAQPQAQFLWAYGLDHGDYDGVSAKWYVKDLPLRRLDDGGVLLAYAVNGEPLTPEHGFPLRLIIPGYYGTNTVKWLWRLELAEGRATGPFTTELYNDPDPTTGGTRPVWEAPPESLIVAPAPSALSATPREIWGWTWAAAGVARVDVSIDGGNTWSPARLESRRQWSWQRFAFDWRPAGAGSYTLAARATDTRGAVQPMHKARNAVHTVTVAIA